MFKYKVIIKKVKGLISESKSVKKSIVIKSEKPLSNDKVFAKAADYYKNKYDFILESADVSSDNTISVYVGTWGKYNGGSLHGEWIDLSDFDTPEEFKKYCHEKLHADENGEAELMFQDVEGPAWVHSVISEYGMNYDMVWGWLALDDYEKDLKSGNYNPLVKKFGKDIESAKEYAKESLIYTLSCGAQEYEKLNILKNKEILDNIIYLGLKQRVYTVLKGKNNEKSV